MYDSVYIFKKEYDEERGPFIDKKVVVDRRKQVAAYYKDNKVKIDSRVKRSGSRFVWCSIASHEETHVFISYRS